MNSLESDQGWRQLQSHIEGFFCRALRGETQEVGYRPRFIGKSTAALPEPQENETAHSLPGKGCRSR
jgi:hypothetical protein